MTPRGQDASDLTPHIISFCFGTATMFVHEEVHHEDL